MKRTIREVLLDLLFCLVGSALVAVAISVFNVPNDSLPAYGNSRRGADYAAQEHLV